MTSQKKINENGKYKVFVVDDHSLVRQGLTEVINRQDDLIVCGEAESVSSAFEAIDTKKPDIAIIGLIIGFESGIRLIQDLKRFHKKLSILVFSMHDESVYAERCFKAGAMGYVMKEAQSKELISAIREIINNELYVSKKLKKTMLQKILRKTNKKTYSPVEILSNRELEVYHMIGKGLRQREIAEKLNLSIKTIDTYVGNIKEKMKFRGIKEILMHAVRFTNAHSKQPA